MPEPDRSLSRSVRAGDFALPQVLELASDLERRIETEMARGTLPERPDAARIDRFLIDAYQATWR